MLNVVCDNVQTILTSCNPYQNIKITDHNTLTCKGMTNFSIVSCPITKMKYIKSLGYHFRFLQMTLNCFAV